MALLSIFGKSKQPAKKSTYISINGSLGNVLISGNAKHSKGIIFNNYLLSFYNNSGGCIIIRDAGSGFSAAPTITTQSHMVYDIDTGDGAFTEQFDPFAGLNDSQTVELLFHIFNKHSEFESSFKMKFKQYLSKLVYFIKLSGQTVKLNQLHTYTIEKLEDINARARISDLEKHQNERFFDSIRQDVFVLESYFYDFSNNNIGFIMSGNQSLEQIISTRKILEISLDFSTRKDESELLLSILTDKIYKFDCAKARVNDLALAIDEIPNEVLLQSGFDKLLTIPNKCHTAFSVMDISMFAEKSNIFIDRADSLFFFQQQSNKNQEYCSEFFGTYEKTKVSSTNTYGSSSGESHSSAWDYWNGNGSRSHNSGSTQSNSYTTTTEKERIYLPDVFKILAENQCIYFFRQNRTHNYLNFN